MQETHGKIQARSARRSPFADISPLLAPVVAEVFVDGRIVPMFKALITVEAASGENGLQRYWSLKTYPVA